ncbi:MAG: FAD:protein FMN transferase [Actinobacteria bacterium]|nr:FAD:protein FMN transferase [Actinomycetota bacterium]
MIVDRFGAMGTQVEVHGTDHAALDEVQAWFALVEACCSRFRPESELSRANARSGQAVEMSPLLAEIMAAADDLRSRTGGLVDAGIGERLIAWGYDRTFAEVADRASIPAPGGGDGWEVDGPLLRLAEGTRLDLGGIAKGWACDRAVEMGLATMVSAGGDLRSSDPTLAVDVRGASGETLAEIAVGMGGLATSSTARRRWTAGHRRVSHLIDPRTGAPVVSPVVGATVTAATALEAEAGAKAVLLLGEEGLAWADRRPWIRSALVEWHDGSVFATAEAAA